MRRVIMLNLVAAGGAACASYTGAEAATVYSFDFAYQYERTIVTESEPRGITLPGPFGLITLDPAVLPFSPFGFDRHRQTTLESLTVDVSGTFTCYNEEADPQLALRPVAVATAAEWEPDVAPRAERLAVGASILAEPLELEEVLAAPIAAGAIGLDGLVNCDILVGDGGDDAGPEAVPTPSAAAAGIGLLMAITVRRRRTPPRRIVG